MRWFERPKWELIVEDHQAHFLQWNPGTDGTKEITHRVDIYKKVQRNGIIKHKVIYKTEVLTGIFLNV